MKSAPLGNYLIGRGNCYKCGDLTVNPHFIAWNSVVNDEPAFHIPEYFGELIFGE